MKSIYDRLIRKPIVRLSTLMNAVATLWTFTLVFFMAFDVMARFFFNHPLRGAPELVKVSMVGLVYLHMANTLWVNRHIRSEIFLSRMSPRVRLVVEIITYLLGCILFIIIVMTNWDYMIRAWEIGEYEGEGALAVPTAPIRSILILGSTVTVLIFIIKIIDNVGALFRITARD